MSKPACKNPDPLLARRACGNCDLFERLPDVNQVAGEDILGECMLHPPTVHGYSDEGDPIQSLPLVLFGDRCGQHRPVLN